jgi:hypothetical protein
MKMCNSTLEITKIDQQPVATILGIDPSHLERPWLAMYQKGGRRRIASVVDAAEASIRTQARGRSAKTAANRSH